MRRRIGLSLAAGRQTGEICGEGCSVSLKVEGLHPAACAGFDPHRAGGDMQCLGKEALKRLIRFALLRNRAHPDLQDRPAIGECFEAADFVAGAFGRQADG